MNDDRARKPLPQIDAVTRPFWDAAAQRQLCMPRCCSCGAFVWLPRPVCSECGSPDHEWVRLSGRGLVYSFTIIRQVLGGASWAFQQDVPYVVAWIDLDEGPRMVSNLVDCSIDRVTIGMTVEVVFEPATQDIWLPKFKPIAAMSSAG